MRDYDPAIGVKCSEITRGIPTSQRMSTSQSTELGALSTKAENCDSVWESQPDVGGMIGGFKHEDARLQAFITRLDDSPLVSSHGHLVRR